MDNPFKALESELQDYRRETFDKLSRNPKVVRFLKENGKDLAFLEKHLSMFSSWLDGVEMCLQCRGTAFCPNPMKGLQTNLKVDEDGFLNEVLEPCARHKKELLEKAHLKNLWINHMEPQAETAKLADFEKGYRTYSQSREVPATVMIALAQVLAGADEPGGLYLYGQPGTGKSYMLSGLANKFAREGKSVCFVKVPMMIQEFKQNLSDDEYRKDFLWKLRNCDILILDDIGAESPTPWTRDEILLPVLDERMNRKKKTYFTSNYNPEELRDQYIFGRQNNPMVGAMRFMERVRTLAAPVELLGASQRETSRTAL